MGFDIDLGNAICAELKVKCMWVESDFDGMIPGLKANKFDGVISSMTVTPVREKAIDFSSELFSGPTSLVFKKGAGYSTPESLKGKSVGYEQGTIQEAYAKAVLDKAGVTTKAYANQDQVYADLTSGRLDASVQDMLQAELGFLKSPAGAGYEVVEQRTNCNAQHQTDEDLPARIIDPVMQIAGNPLGKKTAREEDCHHQRQTWSTCSCRNRPWKKWTTIRPPNPQSPCAPKKA